MSTQKKHMSTSSRNPIAKDLRTSKYRMRIVPMRKGNKAYSRKVKVNYD